MVFCVRGELNLTTSQVLQLLLRVVSNQKEQKKNNETVVQWLFGVTFGCQHKIISTVTTIRDGNRTTITSHLFLGNKYSALSVTYRLPVCNSSAQNVLFYNQPVTSD